ncbi:MAG TPA: hypothetical protein VER04_17580 [Polyangiaceae bacterium]|nr:hypothetical protein [Polyangiaceae bacterium]
MRRRFVCALAACLLAACSSPAPAEQAAAPTFSSVRSEVLLPSCALSTSCHQGSSASGRLQLDGEAKAIRARLVGRTSAVNAGETLVVPGNPDESYLYRKLTGQLADLPCANAADPDGLAATACGERMPYDSTPLSEAKLRLVHDWIAAGALDD